MSTLATLKSDLIEYLKCDPNDKIWQEAQKNRYLNLGYFQIQKDGNFRWGENEATTTQALTGGIAEYSVPSDFIRLDLVNFIDIAGEMTKTSKSDTMRRGTTSNSRPSLYYIYNRKIGLWPTPDTGYTLNILYRKKLPKMTSLVDCSFSEDFDDAIVCYAAYKIWATTKNSAKASQALEDYKLQKQTLFASFLLQDTNELRFGFQKFQGMKGDYRMLSF